MSEDKEIILDTGYNEFILRPCDNALLKLLIKKHFR